MPILSVKALPQENPRRVSAALKKSCLAIAEVYGCRPEQVWAHWTEISPGFYVEGNLGANSQPRSTHPPIAQLTGFEGKSDKEIEEILRVAASTLSRELGIEDNIFMTYQETRSGRVIAGNGVVRNTESDS